VTTSTRKRLAREVRRKDADLAELALCICAERDQDLDVDAALLRVDALADGLLTRGSLTGDPPEDAAALAAYLAGEQGFTGDVEDYHDPVNGLLTEVLDRHRGLPIVLSVLYVAVARRVRIPAWGIAHPGHYYVGVGTPDRPIVLDPFHDGAVVEQEELAARLRAATAGRIDFTRAHLRPAGPATTTRRILNNLTRDFTNRGELEDALWTVECKLVLPNALPDDHRARGELLSHLGRYLRAAEAFETYLGVVGEAAVDADEVRAQAVRARAKLN
jgi:regulator of sirC expression with transglutaminase-like and TPR domain